VPANAGFPDPSRLAQNLELYGTQVSYRPGADEPATVPAPQVADPAPAPALPAGPRGDGYRASVPSSYTLTVPQGFDPDELRRLLELLAGGPPR